ncbi:AI-2E family transporter [Suttonella ornithocola]|uniref:Pheromone autoinducer 2 transporter n=1 Tax=Suttonella ornithocola TaxID=279832 RepID=A0A380MVG0_9GAMM|nr:AI-2E family transporter [Suttonella ornithocola]SUO96545.1 pheromone autoinducer 2 transporter [Suttonella ornithocola]
MNPVWKPLQRILNNPSLVALIFFGLTLWLAFYFVGQWLMPVIIAVIIAYLLEGLIRKLEHLNVRRIFAVCLVFMTFSALIIYIFIVLVPTLLTQAKSLIEHLPNYFSYAQEKLYILPQKFPQFFTDSDIANLVQTVNATLAKTSKNLFSGQFFASIMVIFSFSVYSVLVPILIFFFLKDKKKILNWLRIFLPENRQIITEIWAEVDQQIGNYIRGKFIEVLIIWLASFITFNLFGLQYGLLLGLMVGLSVLIPYIGAAIVTLPVLIVAYVQFGFISNFWWITIIYALIQLIDGNILVPLIFSEAVNIHPIALIIAVLVFGGIWGFWGVFFAIPLAILVKAIIEAWQRYELREQPVIME